MTRKTIGLILVAGLLIMACAGVPGLTQPTPTALPQPTDLPTELSTPAPTEAVSETPTDEAAQTGATPTDEALTDQPTDQSGTDAPTLDDLTADNVGSLKVVGKIKAAGVSFVTIGPNSDQLAAAQGNSILLYANMPFPDSPVTLNGHTGKVNAVSFNSDGTQLVSGSDDGTIRLWDTDSGKELSNINIDGSPVLAVAWSPDGGTIAAGTRKGLVQLIDPTTGKVTVTIKASKDGVALGAITWSLDGSELGTALYQGAVNPGDVSLWDAASGDVLEGGKNSRNYTAPGPTGIAWSPTDDIVAWVNHEKNGQAALWSIGADRNSVVYTGQNNVVTIAWAPTGDMIATSGDDHAIHIWDPTDGKLLGKLVGSPDAVTTVAWSADGTFLVSASADGMIRVWGSITK